MPEFNSWSNLTDTYRQQHSISIPMEIKDFPTDASWGVGYRDIINNVLNSISTANTKISSLGEFFTPSLKAENINTNTQFSEHNSKEARQPCSCKKLSWFGII